MFRNSLALFALFALIIPSTLVAQGKTPYWASLRADKVRMRTGPGRQFPATWLYQRSGLPVKVIESYPNWRKIMDPEGETGWVQGNLLSETRTVVVIGAIRELRKGPDLNAAVTWRAEAGVVGRISQCARGWCLLDVGGRTGYVSTAHVWGVAADERLP